MKKLLSLLPILILGLYACDKKSPPINLVKEPDYKKAESFLYQRNDSAFYYFNKVVTGSKDSLQIAMAYNNMAVIQSDAGDYFGSQESLLTSLKFLDDQKEKDRICLSSDYNELGRNSLNLKNYDSAITYYDSAIKLVKDKSFKLVLLNNKAVVYQKKGEYPAAISLYNAIAPETGKHKKEYARILSNLARTKWLQHHGYHASPELLKALQIRKKENDLWGQNASYSHLADYYTPSYPDSAFLYASEMYAIARRLQSPDDRLEALQKIITLGPTNTVKKYFMIYQELNDSLQSARNAAKNQFAIIRYGAEKSKADNLKLQQDNTEKKYQIARQRILLFGTVFLVVVGTVITVIWYRRRKQRLDLEAQHAIQENQLKTSKKVHDVVANGLYRMMTEIENQDGIDKDRLLDKIEDMYEKSRDISYEKQQPTNQNFYEKLKDLLQAFATENIKVVLVSNENELWKKVNLQVRYEIEQIMQELMVNMKKHSQAGNVVVRFEQKDSKINIYYADDGIGFLPEVQHKNGLISTGNRINHIGGTITFDSNAEKGVKILISFPIS